MDIHIGNFDVNVKEEELRELFSAYGKVESLNIKKNQHTGQSNGYGYVSMPDEKEALQAISQLNNFKLRSRVITVSKAKYKNTYQRSN